MNWSNAAKKNGPKNVPQSQMCLASSCFSLDFQLNRLYFIISLDFSTPAQHQPDFTIITIQRWSSSGEENGWRPLPGAGALSLNVAADNQQRVVLHCWSELRGSPSRAHPSTSAFHHSIRRKQIASLMDEADIKTWWLLLRRCHQLLKELEMFFNSSPPSAGSKQSQ